jgi:hypothetical protein
MSADGLRDVWSRSVLRVRTALSIGTGVASTAPVMAPETGVGPDMSGLQAARWSWSALRWLVFAVPLAQVVWLLWVIWTRTANVPYWDEWATAVLVQHAQQGTLSLHELLAFHGPHRIVLPRLVNLTVIDLTQWNRQVEMMVNVAVGICSALLLWYAMRRSFRSLNLALALVVPLSLLVLSFSQFGNWFAPFQIQFILGVLGTCMCLFAFTKEQMRNRDFAVAMLGSTIATLSTLQGLLPWVTFFPLVFRLGYRKTLIWVGYAGLLWVAYLHDFPSQPHNLVLRDDVKYTLAFLAAPITYQSYKLGYLVALASVAVLFANMFVYWRVHNNLRRIEPWLALAFFVVLCAQATALGRIGGGPLQATVSRYQAFSALWWVALFVVSALNMQAVLNFPAARLRAILPIDRRAIIAANVAAILLASAATIPVNTTGVRAALTWQDDQRRFQSWVVNYKVAPDACLQLYNPWPDRLRASAPFLEQEHLAIFAQPGIKPGLGAYAVGDLAQAKCYRDYGQYIDDVSGQAGAQLALTQEGSAPRKIELFGTGASSWRAAIE